MKYVQIIGVLLGFVVIIGGGHTAIYHAIKAVTTLSDFHLKYLARGLAILSVSFVVMSIMINMYYSWVGSWLYTASAIWLGTAYRLLIASCVILGSIGLTYLVGYSPSRVIRPARVLLVMACMTSIYGVYHSTQTQVTYYKVAINNLPDSREGQSIAFIADTHVGAVRNIGQIRRITSLIEAHNPQVLLIAGDYFDGPKANDQQLAQTLGAITTTYGTYLAPGNHEEYGNLNNYINVLQQAGVNVLNNQVVDLNGLQLIGVDYSSTTSRDGFAQILEGLQLDPSQPQILIKHVPSHTEIVDRYGIDLQVAGHVHQGQIRPGPWVVRKIYGIYAYGMHTMGKSVIITTSGVGTRGPPQRIGTSSEIVILTVVQAL